MNNKGSHLIRLTSLTSNILIILILLASVATFSGKLFGIKNKGWFSKSESLKDRIIKNNTFLKSENWKSVSAGIWVKKEQAGQNEETIVFSEAFANDIQGFGGPISLLIFLDSENKIKKVQISQNYETPEFLEDILKANWLAQFDQKSTKEVVENDFDAISGATISTEAIITSIKKSVAGYLKLTGKADIKVADKSWYESIGIYRWLGLATILSALIIFLQFKSSKSLRTFQLVANVIILGGLCGALLSTQGFLKYISNGFNLKSGLLPGVIIGSIIILLIFNKKNFYCYWVCPYGSLQELLGRLTKKKFAFSPKIQKHLFNFREYLFYVLLFFSWIIGGSWVFQFEPFSAFLQNQASGAVLFIASLFLILSIFVNRCWCRYFCPAGAALNFIQNTNTEK